MIQPDGHAHAPERMESLSRARPPPGRSNRNARESLRPLVSRDPPLQKKPARPREEKPLGRAFPTFTHDFPRSALLRHLEKKSTHEINVTIRVTRETQPV